MHAARLVTSLPAVFALPGRTPVPVTLVVQNGAVFVEGKGVHRAAAVSSLLIDHTSPPGSIVRFPDGATCEVPDTATLLRLLDDSGRSQWDTGVPRVLWAILATFLLIAIAFYIYGIPFVARLAADAVPSSVTTPLSESVLASLDESTFAPSALSAGRQRRIRDAFARLAGEDGPSPYRLEFRKGGTIGPNALALPSGLIVVTDELVQLARDDQEIVSVLAHEAGHVAERHGVRLIFQQSALGMLLAWVAGDVSTLVAAAPAALLEAKYSRDFERDADQYAAAVLTRRGIPPAKLADLLERIERSARGESAAAGASLLDYTSSHPATAERLAYLRGL